MTRPARGKHSLSRLLGLCLVGLVVPAGCHRTHSELLIQSGITGPEAPEWAKGTPQDLTMPDEVFFVGRSVACNVADEAAAVQAAREDVYQQIAGLIATRVTTRARRRGSRVNTESNFVHYKHDSAWPHWQDYQAKMRFLPGPEVQQAMVREAWFFTSCVAGDLLDRGVYFEKWDLREVHHGLGERKLTEDQQLAGVYGRARGMVRYKCWVRMSIPRAKLEARIQEFQGYVKDAYTRFTTERKRAADWAQEDRDVRIKREEDGRVWTRQDQHEDRAEARELRRIMSVDRVRFRVISSNCN